MIFGIDGLRNEKRQSFLFFWEKKPDVDATKHVKM